MSEGPLEQRVEAARQRENWRRSLEFKKAQRGVTFRIGAAGVIALIIIFILPLSDVTAPTSTSDSIFYLAAAAFCLIVAAWISKEDIRYKYERFQDAQLLERYGDLVDEQSKLLDEDQLRLGELWRLSEERLRVYHQIATRQANASFRNAQWAIAAGFIVIIVGSYAVFFAKNVTIAIVVGALGGAGAALSAYIGKTFLRLQENAASHLQAYFDQPKEQFRYLAAERLLSHLASDRQKATAINEIIRSIASSK